MTGMRDDEDLKGAEGEHGAGEAGGSSRYGANLSGRQYAMIVAGLGLGTALEW
jgi:hypothetical protein